jgi:hypothetical protein
MDDKNCFTVVKQVDLFESKNKPFLLNKVPKTTYTQN